MQGKLKEEYQQTINKSLKEQQHVLMIQFNRVIQNLKDEYVQAGNREREEEVQRVGQFSQQNCKQLLGLIAFEDGPVAELETQRR